MEMIRATVNPRLLEKATRLFTGTREGRIIEILQNARRAGATTVEITNEGGNVTVCDNGRGIDDVAGLLDLGRSGWDEDLEASEDPAGVGLFCLAPREVTIRSKGRLVTIVGDGWTGAPVPVHPDPHPVDGTVLRFPDDPWDAQTVKPHAVFTGLNVVVDDEPCPSEPFITGEAAHFPGLGCRITVASSEDVTEWHRAMPSECWRPGTLVNFHGQVVSLAYQPITHHQLWYLVDLTGEPTGIRLMLPARTRLVDNDALILLKAAIESEGYRYLQRLGKHRLPYTQYLRAKRMGIDLPEAEPTYQVGLLSSDLGPEPVAVVMPEGHSLDRCYRLAPDREGDETDEANVHLLAALGEFKEPFVPVFIRREYEGYRWSQLPTVGRVDLSVGRSLQESWVWLGNLTCVDALSIVAKTSDGNVFYSPVCMAVKPWPKKRKKSWYGDYAVYVTPRAQEILSPSAIWHHLGGYQDEGDTYDTQEYDVIKQLEEFWTRLHGPDELLRSRLMACMDGSKKNWETVTLTRDGRVALRFKDGTEKKMRPPTGPREDQS